MADGSGDEKKRQRRHKHKSKRKRLEKVVAPPPLRPRSRPASQQDGTRSEGTSSDGCVAELEEGPNATKQNEKQDLQLVKLSTGNEEDVKVINILHDNEQVTEETPAMGDDKMHILDESNNINSNPIDTEKETEPTAE